MPRLFIRFDGALVRTDADAFDVETDWLVCDDAGSMTAQGRTDGNDLAAVVAREAPWATDSTRVVVFVPTAEVVGLRCDVPGRSAAQLRRAARYAVEPFIAEDIDTMHVACGALARHEPVRCLVVPRRTMTDWLKCLTSVGIAPGYITPDAMALPSVPNGVTVLYDGDSALVRTTDEIASIDLANLGPTLETLRSGFDESASPMLRQVNGTLSEVELRAGGFAAAEVHDVPVEDSLLAFLAASFELGDAIDLLQGEFTVKRRATGAWMRWRPAAALAAGWLALAAVITGAQGFWANQRADGYREQAIALYREIYGVERAPGNPATRMRVRLGQAPETRLGFQRVLGYLGVALSELSERYELRSVSYNERSGFGADVVVADYEVLDQLKLALGRQGLDLEIVSAEQHEDRARASIRIADHWIGPGWSGAKRG